MKNILGVNTAPPNSFGGGGVITPLPPLHWTSMGTTFVGVPIQGLIFIPYLLSNLFLGIDNFNVTSYLGVWYEYSNMFEFFEVRFYIYQSVGVNILICLMSSR